MLIATDFLFLKDVPGDGSARVKLEREPIGVYTVVNEGLFFVKHALVHGQTVFFDDRMHDWNWSDGVLRYYTRTGSPRNVVAVYATKEDEIVVRFDPMTGERLVQD